MRSDIQKCVDEMGVVETVQAVLDVKERLRLVGRWLAPAVTVPCSIIVWLSVADPARFSPAGIVGGVTAWAGTQLGRRIDPPPWMVTSLELLTAHPELRWLFIFVALFLAVICRPPQGSDQGPEAGPWFVIVGWVAAVAAVGSGGSRLLFIVFMIFAMCLLLSQGSRVPDAVSRLTHHVGESFNAAVFHPLIVIIGFAQLVTRRMTGGTPEIPPAARPSYANANQMMMAMAFRRAEHRDLHVSRQCRQPRQHPHGPVEHLQ